MTRRRKPSPWTYDPRPVDRLTISVTYDWRDYRYRLVTRVWHHGDSVPVAETVEGLSRDEVADQVAVVLSSMAEEGVDPF